MTEYRRLRAFYEAVDLVNNEFAERDIPIKPGAAADLVAERVELVADRLIITPRQALNYFTPDTVRNLAQNTMKIWRDHEVSENARPPVQLSGSRAGLVISSFTVAARLGIVNGDPDVAADLCEVIVRVGVHLRRQDSPIVVPRLPLANGLMWASLCADQLASGAWTVLPGKTGPDDDRRVTTQLRDDLRSITQMLQ